jgi:hypothetical protein
MYFDCTVLNVGMSTVLPVSPVTSCFEWFNLVRVSVMVGCEESFS